VLRGDAQVTVALSVLRNPFPSRIMPMTFRDLEVWKRSLLLVADVYRVTTKLPRDERFGLTAQLRRAAVSVTCNIAEGYGRATRGEYLNQLSVARGSLNEVEALCEVCRILDLLTAQDLAAVDDHLGHMRRMLGTLRIRLQQSRRPRKTR
jgi:four helix bundle protein